MYVLVKYEIISDDGKGNSTSKPIHIIDYSKDIEKFKHLIPSFTTFYTLGYCDVTRKYRGKRTVLLDLPKLDSQNANSTQRIIKMVREKAISDVLSV